MFELYLNAVTIVPGKVQIIICIVDVDLWMLQNLTYVYVYIWICIFYIWTMHIVHVLFCTKTEWQSTDSCHLVTWISHRIGNCPVAQGLRWLSAILQSPCRAGQTMLSWDYGFDHHGHTCHPTTHGGHRHDEVGQSTCSKRIIEIKRTNKSFCVPQGHK